jgi:hypothetical protein
VPLSLAGVRVVAPELRLRVLHLPTGDEARRDPDPVPDQDEGAVLPISAQPLRSVPPISLGGSDANFGVIEPKVPVEQFPESLFQEPWGPGPERANSGPINLST